MSLFTFRWEILQTRLFYSLNKPLSCFETWAHKGEASIWCVFLITVRRLWPDGRDATLDKLQSHFCSLWNLTLNLPKNFPNIRICPQKVAAGFVIVLSGSDSLKWKSFTFSDQLECLPSTHRRASVDLERSRESMRSTLHVKQKMHFGKK